MAFTSKCGGCGATRFEAKSMEPAGSNYILTAIQCASCGVVVGVMDSFNIGSLVRGLIRKLGFDPDRIGS